MPNYRFDQHGTLTLCHDKGDVLTRHDPSESIAVFYDANDGVLFKHGAAPLVRDYAHKTRSKLAAADRTGDLTAALTVLEFPVKILKIPGVLEEINACLDISGRIATLQEKLTILLPDTPISETENHYE